MTGKPAKKFHGVGVGPLSKTCNSRAPVNVILNFILNKTMAVFSKFCQKIMIHQNSKAMEIFVGTGEK